MFKRKPIAIVIAMLAILAIVGLGVAQMGKKQKKVLAKGKTLRTQYMTPEQDKKLAKQREEATPVQEGVMTEKQKKHSQRFKGYDDVTKGKKLREIMERTGNDVNVGRLVGNMIVPNAFNLPQYLQDLTCKADLIVIGKLKGKASQLNEEGTFTFTEYEISVDEVLKNNPAAPIKANKLTVVRSGGTISLDGHNVTATDFSEKPLEKGGRYLLFLKFIPETGAYSSLNGGSNLSDDSFRLFGNQLVQVSDQPLPFGPNNLSDSDAVLTQIRTAANSGCNNQGGGR